MRFSRAMDRVTEKRRENSQQIVDRSNIKHMLVVNDANDANDANDER